MIKVKLHFSLVGRAEMSKKSILNSDKNEFANSDMLDYIKDSVANYFGDRTMIIINKDMLVNNAITYPKFYSAGWFITEDMKEELVVVGHGENARLH